ncbi:DUF4921 family protein [Acidipropionibacterium virtanenii]|uniref:DUF4921 domain-containing protein n=1 Tax=Acidipropionibacterium virtanenii TaxID=2057246 RepID=A0A344UQP6_9ACTN|nr:DUF4921 family protein [Acidipropionibacterium virtanenii]AXE37594.1 hypothetical protein JS278_00397 [Acidipropionibacterium virtanenii]
MTANDEHSYYRELADGTIKQVNPFTGVQVWTVPGRGSRPLSRPITDPRPITDADRVAACAFCQNRVLETPPEKSRLIPTLSTGASSADDSTEIMRGYRVLRHVPAGDLSATTAEFRRIPNLFEILSWEYWHANHGLELPADARHWQEDYLSDPAGLAHVHRILDSKFAAQGLDLQATRLSAADLRGESAPFFAGGHDVVLARRHYADDATTTAGLAGSGTLSVLEHRAFIAATVATMGNLYASNPEARYVAAFQNWLKPAGASFDHLHKQLVAIDDIGHSNDEVLSRATGDPAMFNRWGPDFAIGHNHILAANDDAVAFVGFGHRYPSVEVWSTDSCDQPWRMDAGKVDAVSDLLHAMHVAVGTDVPSNEEWHHRPVGVGTPMPWRIILKLRVSTLAGFEGSTKVYVNTISPASLTARLLPRLVSARRAGRIAEMRIGAECDLPRGILQSVG